MYSPFLKGMLIGFTITAIGGFCLTVLIEYKEAKETSKK